MAIKKLSPACIAIDFDGTLAHFEGGYDPLLNIFISRGISIHNVAQAFEKAISAGFTIDTMIDVLEEKGETIDSREEIKTEFKRWLTSSLKLFPGVKEILGRWNADYPVVIVTAGDQEYQQEKIKLLGVPHAALYVVKFGGGKVAALRKLIETYGTPILFIEDSEKELNSIREDGIGEDEVIPFFLVRNRSEEKPTAEKPFYHQAASLEEIDQLLH